MGGAGAVPGEGPQVEFGGIALVLGEAVVGEFFMQFEHEAVADDFGEDGGGLKMAWQTLEPATPEILSNSSIIRGLIVGAIDGN